MDKLQKTIAKFPVFFRLRAFPGKRFRIAPPPASFVDNGKVWLVVQVDRERIWLDFSRVTEDELRQEFVADDNLIPESRCFVCRRKLGRNPYLADTGEDQAVYVGSECAKKIIASGEEGWMPGLDGSEVRLWAMTEERAKYFKDRFNVPPD